VVGPGGEPDAAETPVAAVPDPALFDVAFDPYDVLRPYSNHQLVEPPG
jgi:hypothetical protein